MDYPLRKPKKDKALLVKVNADERMEIERKASRHTGGNVSQWMRKAAISFEPTPPVCPEDDAC